MYEITDGHGDRFDPRRTIEMGENRVGREGGARAARIVSML